MTGRHTVFAAPPKRTGSGPARDAHEWGLADACRDRPGHWALYGTFASQPDAEVLRRRIKRGRGPWEGGRDVWCIAVRKVTDGQWTLHVAYAPADWVAAS